MTRRERLASIGVPVFQGEDYLEETLRAALAQDYQMLEVVVSDNASTDGTAEITRRYLSDPRVRYVRQSENIGAAENYNAVLRASSGTYFAWNAHDDYSSPDFIRYAVAALEATPDAVVAVARPFRVNQRGKVIKEMPFPRELTSSSPSVRFRAGARVDPVTVIFGLFRSDVLDQTMLHGRFTGSDRNLVAEAMLYGRLVQAGESRFYLREHRDRSVRRLGRGQSRFSHPREAWYDPTRAGKLVFPSWRRLGSYLTAVMRAPLGFRQRLHCFGALVRIITDDNFQLARYMANDLVTAVIFLAKAVRRDRGNNASASPRSDVAT